MAKPGRRPTPPAAGGKPVYEQKKELREVTARMEELRRLIASRGEEVRAARAAINAGNETLRELRLSIGERQAALQGLRDSMAAAQKERDILDVRRERLKTLLELTPAPDDGAT